MIDTLSPVRLHDFSVRNVIIPFTLLLEAGKVTFLDYNPRHIGWEFGELYSRKSNISKFQFFPCSRKHDAQECRVLSPAFEGAGDVEQAFVKLKAIPFKRQ